MFVYLFFCGLKPKKQFIKLAKWLQPRPTMTMHVKLFFLFDVIIILFHLNSHLSIYSGSNTTTTYYSNATISAPPTTTTPSSNSELKENGDVRPPAANVCPLVTATGAGSKIIHPPEDVSLEEIRARNAKYRAKPKPDAPAAQQPAPAPAMITPSTSQAEVWVSGSFIFIYLCRLKALWCSLLFLHHHCFNIFCCLLITQLDCHVSVTKPR